MENIFSLLKIERVACKVYRTCSQARAAIDTFEVFQRPTRRHSSPGHVSPIKYEAMPFACGGFHETGSISDKRTALKSIEE